MKDLGWFKFSPLNWMTGRIRKEPEKIQIAFIELICLYWKNGCRMTIESSELEIGDKINTLLKRKIVKQDGDFIKISFLDDQILSIEDTSAVRSKAAQSRWNKLQSKSMQVHASALQDNANGMQIDADREIDREIDREDKKERVSDKSLSRTLEVRKKDFYNLLTTEKNNYSKKMLRAFYEYWTEHSPAGKKLRFEKEKVFDVKKRLVTWAKREGIEPKEETQKDYSNAEIDRKNLNIPAWEEIYEYYLQNDNDFRKHFGYDELPKSIAVGSNHKS